MRSATDRSSHATAGGGAMRSGDNALSTCMPRTKYLVYEISHHHVQQPRFFCPSLPPSLKEYVHITA